MCLLAAQNPCGRPCPAPSALLQCARDGGPAASPSAPTQSRSAADLLRSVLSASPDSVLLEVETVKQAVIAARGSHQKRSSAKPVDLEGLAHELASAGLYTTLRQGER